MQGKFEVGCKKRRLELDVWGDDGILEMSLPNRRQICPPRVRFRPFPARLCHSRHYPTRTRSINAMRRKSTPKINAKNRAGGRNRSNHRALSFRGWEIVEATVI